MNQSQTRSPRKRWLSLILAVVLMIGLLPISAFASNTGAQADDSGSAAESQFLRIFHLDCGRKYFTVDQIKQMIDYAAESNYTHVELAFGNDGLRFLLDDMSLTVSGKTYGSEEVSKAIHAGNEAYYDFDVDELTQTEMDTIIAYAREKKIGIIPMFDAPGHLQAVIRGMRETLGLNVDYTTPTTSGTSVNWAINPTDTASLAFVKALMEKYVAYFAKYGSSKYFNIAADECGFAQMSTEQYTAYATFVNSLAAMVKSYGFTVMAFNDGFYYQNKTTTEDFDTDIVICYWDASADKYAPASALASKNFRIINTHNKWYYVIGNESTGWYGAEWSKSNMTGQYSKCNVTDGDYQTNYGCMNAIWCDNPSANVNMANVETHIKTLAQQTCNKSFFTEVTTTPTGPDPVEPTESKTAADAELKVSVTVNLKAGQNLTLAVSKVENSQAVFDQGVEFVAYDVTPSVDGEPYRGQGTVTLPVPAEWTAHKDRIGAYIITDGKTVTLTEVTVADDKVTFTAPHFSEMGLYLAAEGTDPDVPENRTVTVTAGKTYSDTITGANYAGNTCVTENPDIAAVTVTGTDEQKESYNPNTVYAGNLANNNRSWAKTDYYYTDNNINYYPVYGKYERNGRARTYYWGYSTTDSAANVTVINESTNYNMQVTVYTKSSDPTPASTTVTFTGKKVGTTYVTVGTVRYTINVVTEDLDGVNALPIQLWITNNTIQVDETDKTKTATGSGWGGNSSLGNANYVSVAAGRAYGEQGVTLKEAIGLTEPLVRYEYGGTRFIAVQEGKPAQNLVLWSGRIHNSGNIQQVWGTDYSNSGEEFNYVRYWDGEWAVSNDRKAWTKVTGEGSTGTYSSCKEQLAAYYMVRTEITKEVTTDIADWGKPKSGNEYASQVNDDFVLLDFAVKYENGNRVPSEFPVNDTMAFHCASNDSAVGTQNGVNYRKLNNFRGVNTSDYEIYMVTVTMTNDNASTTLTSSTAMNGYTYDGTEQIVWAIDEKTKTNSNLDAYTSISGADSAYSGCTIGGDPYVRGVEIYNKHGALITYYIRAKVKTDSLSVHYVVQNTGEEFYKYYINVNNEAGHDMAFKDGIQLNNPWKGELRNSEVVNAEGRTLTITADLTNLPIDAQYRYSTYTCVKVETKKVNDVNKEVWLYYTFTRTATFVVDFGLPLKIAPADVSDNLSGAPIKTVQIAHSTKYADLSVDENNNIIYRLTKTIDGEDNITVRYTGTNASTDKIGEASFTLTIIPASNVYYEDSLASFTNGSGVAKEAKWSVVDNDGNENATETTNVYQALEELGSAMHNVYGYDDAYNKENSSMLSMGTAHKVTVTPEMLSNWKDGSAWPTASFTFTGTGFDVISLTDNTSGAILVSVTGEDYNKNFLVDNYYGYNYNEETGEWTIDKTGGNNALYQIPVMKVTDLPHGTYSVTIQVFYHELFDQTADKGTGDDDGYNFWLDAIRVYNPMGENGNSYYTQDNEGYPQYIKLHDALAKTAGTNNGVVFIDGAENASIADYANFGPNNEVYLAKGQAISFKVTGDTSEIASIQIGAKAPDGKKANIVVTGDATGTNPFNKELGTATEMYYDITDQAKNGQLVTIANKGEGILSLTNLKITYKDKDHKEVTLSDLTAEEQTNAVAMVQALFAAPVETFQPERFEASWGGSVRAGRKATLTVKTSEDVNAITVNGETVSSYTTRTERTGWGWWSPKVTYRVFTYTTAAPAQTTDYAVCAVNAEGTASEPITATLTVRPATWWNWWF